MARLTAADARDTSRCRAARLRCIYTPVVHFRSVIERGGTRGWMRFVVRREERTRTTWTFRFALLVLVVGTSWLSSGLWSPAVARSLICEEDRSRSDALLLENFDADYLVFERAAALRRAGVAERVLVPTRTDIGSGNPNAVALGTAELMARIARLPGMEVVPIPEVEPISLNAGYRIREFLEHEHIRSVTVVSPLFRSRRSALVYGATLGAGGITVRCVPVPATTTPENWTRSWHGIQGVVEQWAKLQYYRFYVLPIRAEAGIGKRE
jgi:hypothetical protein